MPLNQSENASASPGHRALAIQEDLVVDDHHPQEGEPSGDVISLEAVGPERIAFLESGHRV